MKKKPTTAHDTLAAMMESIRQGSKSLPGPVDSFKFAGVVWWRLETPGGNSMIVGLPDSPTRKSRAPKVKP